MTMHFPARDLVDATPEQNTGCDRQTAPLGLLNTYSSRNLGDAAIAAAICQLSGVAEVRANIRDASPVFIAGLSANQDLSACDRYVSVGGDIFNNARPRFLTRNFVSNVYRLNALADRTIVFGQTIPSSCGWLGLPLLASALRRTRAVVVRDRESYQALRKLGVEARLSHDAAFALRPTEPGVWSAEKLFASHGLSPAKTILLSVRSFDAIYPQDQAQFHSSMVELATRLIDRGHQVAVMIQSDVNENDSDGTVARQMQHAEPRLKRLNFIDDESIANPVETLIGALMIARSVVAVRYHAAVLRMVGGRQPYHLHYSRKGRDLHQRHGLTGCAVQDLNPTEAVADIEALAEADFKAHPLRKDVQSAFATAFGRLS